MPSTPAASPWYHGNRRHGCHHEHVSPADIERYKAANYGREPHGIRVGQCKVCDCKRKGPFSWTAENPFVSTSP